MLAQVISTQRFVLRAPRTVGLGKDHTIFALVDGRVAFRTKAKGRSYVSVEPFVEAAE